MDVKIRPLPGCLMIILGICTLGVAPLAIKKKEKHWPKTMDESGLTTQSGQFIGWSEFSQIVKVVSNVNRTVVERFDLHSPKGTVGVYLPRIENAQEVYDYLWNHLPESAKADQS